MKLNRAYAAPAATACRDSAVSARGRCCCPAGLDATVFEPRYLAMLDDALSGERLVGVIQPAGVERRRVAAGTSSDRLPGRIVQFAEIGDGRCFSSSASRASGSSRSFPTPRLTGSPRLCPLRGGSWRARARRPWTRSCCLDPQALRRGEQVKVAWGDIKKASNEALVNGLSMMSPCGRAK
jgi:hypothetical protein